MESYILIDGTVSQKTWWNQLILACAVPGEIFEIHCWADEKREAQQALRFGKRLTSTWRDGTVIRGIITKEFINYLIRMEKPSDTAIYNKMTPFFTIILGNRLHSEHYGTEMILTRHAASFQPRVDRILNQLETCARVYRNVG